MLRRRDEQHDEGEHHVSGDPVAAFWRPLKAEVDRSGVSRRELCDRLRMSASSLSELLNGRRAKAPDWDVVRTIVSACGGPLAYWRRRHEELESELAHAAPPARADEPREPAAEPPGCAACRQAQDRGRFDAYAWTGDDEWEPSSLLGAVRVLADGNRDVRNEVQVMVGGVLRAEGDLVAFRDQFTDITGRLLSGLGARVRRSCHRHRVRLLHAAHTVVIVEGGVRGPVLELSLELNATARWEVELAAFFQDSLGDGTFAAAPLPVADAPYTDHRTRAEEHYAEFAEQVTGTTPPRHVRRESAIVYQERLLELAAECPEAYVWASLQDGPRAAEALRTCPPGPARDRLETLYRRLDGRKSGLGGVETLLGALARDTTPSEWPGRLSGVYRRELARPISPVGEAGDASPGPRIPQLAHGYVNPAFRTAVHSADSTPHIDSWWNTRPLREEIQGFLAGHLTGFPTVDRPLLVLGDPGTGKSLLTRLLAARLPPTDYLPIRVELRNVTADAEIADQIAQALQQATQKDLTWWAVTESSADALPVLIFDGFDELLQAGAASHWSYLEDIAAFQQTSADNGRPVVVVVTSRTVVADQARIPDGTVMIRLEPFDDVRITHWTDAWNATNRRVNRPLRPDLGTLHPELAPQPLLLLMLALYYTVEHDTGPDDAQPMSRVTLYERLLGLFVRRQIRKLAPRLRPEELEEKVEEELDLLSVIACAMFNRGRQGVSAEEADHDLRHLRAPNRAASTAVARLVFGRFFFIHEARATYGNGADRRWYEFLHATFGEHLVARKIARTLRHCPDRGTYEGLLFALLSFAPLTDRAQIIENLRDLLPATAPVAVLFRRALHGLPADGDTAYTTGPVTVTYRHACHSANLLLLALARDDIVRFATLAAEGADPAESWRTHAMLWKSQFTQSSWDAFTLAVGTVPLSHPVRDVAVTLNHHDAPPAAGNLSWHLPGPAGLRIRPAAGSEALRRSRPLHDPDTEFLLEPALPVFEELEDFTSVFVCDRLGRRVSAAHALIALLLCPREPHEELLHRYRTCLDLCGAYRGAGSVRFIGVISGRLAGESESLPVDFVLDAVNTLFRAAKDAGRLENATRVALLVCVCRLLTRAHRDGPGELFASLLDLGPQYGAVPRLGNAELVLSAVFRTLRDAAPGDGRDRPLVWLLKLAVALDARAWSDRYGGWLLDELGPAARDMLSPADSEYLRASFSFRDHDTDLRPHGQGRHP
ncbi:AAA family ATPase [Streptomyces sp. NPDC017936]|uniref:NACHT N-terminal helical domain 7-containing protein n=1 Tax=Streptomyces sp. NPDC017936 TaxID=3365016 RepID=UPI0037BBF86C